MVCIRTGTNVYYDFCDGGLRSYQMSKVGLADNRHTGEGTRGSCDSSSTIC